jgi:hypothetical protein
VPTMQWKPWGLVLGHGLPGATAAAAVRGKSKPVASRSSGACLPGAGFQETQKLLPSRENKAFGHWEPWGLLAGAGFQDCSSAAAASIGTKPAGLHLL